MLDFAGLIEVGSVVEMVCVRKGRIMLEATSDLRGGNKLVLPLQMCRVVHFGIRHRL